MLDDKKITLGYVFRFGSSAIPWTSTKQMTISLSSTNAEYKVVLGIACEARCLRRILEDTRVQQSGVIPLCCDNQRVSELVKYLVFNLKMKHVGIHHYVILEKL
jgi:hypothetical protein